MKITSVLNCLIALVCGALTLTAAEEPPRLSLHRSNAGLELSWPGTTIGTDGSTLRPYFELQRSFDLRLWQPLGERMRVAAAMPEQSLSTTLALDQPHAFYRLLSIEPNGGTKLASGGAQVFGYADAFTQELQRIGQISVAQFAAMFTNDASYLLGISWDPTTAQFWSQFSADPNEVNQGKDEAAPGYRTFDFRLTQPEQTVFKQNGFVVSQRLGSSSFAGVFYNVWHNDLPVFVSTDAILQAWHRTYDAMLEEIEETYLFNSVETMLDGMAGRIAAASDEVGNGVLRDSLLDADYFLAVARSILAGTNSPVLSLLGQNAQVAETVADIKAQEFKRVENFMGLCRVVDSILWDEDGNPGPEDKVQRRVPGALDVAFSVLGNDQVVPELVAQMQGTFVDLDRPHARRFRDGLPYQHNLTAVRAVMDQQTPEAWDSNFYMNWLACLRELSGLTTDAKYPEAMRTRAWAMKTLNTQLSSWTQLRHDTILYTKQSYTGGDGCFYPAGFVEPRVAFWQRLRAMASRAADMIGSLPYSGTYSLITSEWQFDPTTGDDQLVSTTNSILMASVQSNQVAHLRRFADTLGTRQTLAEKELSQECFGADDELFIRNLIQDVGSISQGCDGVRKYDGWYPKLFYHPLFFAYVGGAQWETLFQKNFGANAADQLVADVHTDVSDPQVDDPGSVLHEGVGRVNLLMIAVENGSDRMVFAGPVLSHYEFEITGPPRRLDDNEWSGILGGNFPPDVAPSRLEGLSPPTWTQDYLVP